MLTNLPLFCPGCGRKYMRQSCYDKHKLLCYNTESSSIISQTVKELVRSNNVLKTEIAELRRQSQKQKKKIPIIDLLKKNYTPTENYTEYLNIEIIRADLETIFANDLLYGIQEIIQNKCSNEDNCPLQAFDVNENKIYGYTETQNWEIISKENFKEIILKIIKLIMGEFKRWQDEHIHELYTDSFSQIYFKNIQKVMSGNITNEKLCKKIHDNLYKSLKKPITNIEYLIS